jgi:hypothetical protein
MRASQDLVLGFRGSERDHSSACEEDSLREDLEGRLIDRWWMSIGGVLGRRNFPVS